MGLYTPTILGGNSYLSWFYDSRAIKDPSHTGTSKGLSQAIKRGPIRKFLPKYANVYVTIQGHGLSAGVRAHYVTANGVRDRLHPPPLTFVVPRPTPFHSQLPHSAVTFLCHMTVLPEATLKKMLFPVQRLNEFSTAEWELLILILIFFF